MGIKRSVEEEILEGFSLEKNKRHYNGETHTSYAAEFASHVTDLIVNSPGQMKHNFTDMHYDGLYIDDYNTDGAIVSDKEFESSVPISGVTSSSSEEDTGNGNSSFVCHFPGELSMPSHCVGQFEDPYVSLFNRPPRKEVPIGPNYQAKVPLWDPIVRAEYVSYSNRNNKLMGTCIIKSSDLSDLIIDGCRVGRGRTDCTCFDVGSMRCVQQHVKEVREKLRENVGDKAYKELGFDNMGEVVSSKWNPDEEQLFHEIIFSNPASHGRKYWRHLRAAFPKCSMMELVSYYFNVFMLHRRAIQNRSYFLEIDSEDDEEHKGDNGDLYQNRSHSSDEDSDNDVDDYYNDHLGSEGLCCVVKGDEEDSKVEPLDNHDLDSSWADEFWPEPDNVDSGVELDKNQSSSDDSVQD